MIDEIIIMCEYQTINHEIKIQKCISIVVTIGL